MSYGARRAGRSAAALSVVNRFFICDVWHHVENRRSIFLYEKNAQDRRRDRHDRLPQKDLPVGPPLQNKIAAKID